MYTLYWTISLTAVGAGCTGPTTVVLNDIFTDPAGISRTNTIGTIYVTTATAPLGTLGTVANGSETILAKNATPISYDTTGYTAGTACTTNPTYQVSYVFAQLH